MARSLARGTRPARSLGAHGPLARSQIVFLFLAKFSKPEFVKQNYKSIAENRKKTAKNRKKPQKTARLK